MSPPAVAFASAAGFDADAPELVELLELPQPTAPPIAAAVATTAAIECHRVNSIFVLLCIARLGSRFYGGLDERAMNGQTAGSSTQAAAPPPARFATPARPPWARAMT